MPSRKELRILQGLPLKLKIRKTMERIREWVEYFGLDGVYIAFSGGKDSTVLLDIARSMYPDILAVFVDTGLEYPEIRKFVKEVDNVTRLEPEMSFRKVVETYGYPFFGKEIAKSIGLAKRYMEECEKHGEWASQEAFVKGTKYTGMDAYKKMFGVGYENSMYSYYKYSFMLEFPWKISAKCCDIMKKNPSHRFAKESGRVAMTAVMAEDSLLRTQKWLDNGCNGFDLKEPVSNPMGFWTEQDVLYYYQYIAYTQSRKLNMCSVYGKIMNKFDIYNELKKGADGQLLKCTGCSRTGCMFCGFGCQARNDERFYRMKYTHPKLYEYIMKPWDSGGLGYKEVIDWINENNDSGMFIKY